MKSPSFLDFINTDLTEENCLDYLKYLFPNMHIWWDKYNPIDIDSCLDHCSEETKKFTKELIEKHNKEEYLPRISALQKELRKYLDFIITKTTRGRTEEPSEYEIWIERMSRRPSLLGEGVFRPFQEIEEILNAELEIITQGVVIEGGKFQVVPNINPYSFRSLLFWEFAIFLGRVDLAWIKLCPECRMRYFVSSKQKQIYCKGPEKCQEKAKQRRRVMEGRAKRDMQKLHEKEKLEKEERKRAAREKRRSKSKNVTLDFIKK